MLPLGVPYGKVTGRFLAAVQDGPDDGPYPDAIPLPAFGVTFTPLEQFYKFPSAEPPVTVAPVPVVCSIGDNGLLLDPQGQPGVYLVAGDYEARIDVEGRAPVRLNLSVPAGGETDMVTHF